MNPKVLEWQFDVPLLTNRFIIYDLLKVVGITIAIFAAIFIGISIASDGKIDLKTLVSLARITGLTATILLVLMALVMLLFFFNYFPMRFHLSARGVRTESLSRRGKWANRLAVILGALSGRPGMAGAGLLAISQEMASMEWREVHRINVHPRARVISLMNSWRVVLRLFCTPDNFPQVLEAVREWAEAGKQARERSAPKATPKVWLRQVGLSLLALVAGIFLTALPLKVPGALKVALTLAAMLTVWLPWRRVLGIAVLALTAVTLILFLNGATESRQLFQESDYLAWAHRQGQKIEKFPDWALFKKRQYERFDTGDWVGAGMGSLGLLFFGWLGLAGTRGSLEPTRFGSSDFKESKR